MADSRSTDGNIQLARYEFKRALEELASASGRGTELVSVYVPANKPISDAANYLRQEYGQAANIKSSSTKKNVQGALSSILAELKRFPTVAPPSGIAIFVGSKSIGSNKTRQVKHVLLPPEPVTFFKYHCDSSFFVEPLAGMLEEHNVFGLFVIDRQECTLGLLKGEHIELKKSMESMVPRKHRMGGQSQHRMERVIEELADQFFQKCCDAANEIFLREKDLRGILIGGPGYTKVYVSEQGWLRHELKKKIVNTFDTGYTDEYGLTELVQNAKETLRQLGLTRERDLLGRFMQQIVKDAQLVAYGEAAVRNALSIGAVDTLLLSEKLRKQRAFVACSTQSCGHKEEHTASDLDKLAESLGKCPECGQDSLEVASSQDIIEEMSELATQTGTKVELISDATDEGKQFHDAFGGMGALLRFKVQG
ncbi:MAG: peptide chain release factor aRF-1 [Halobacteriales archaeon]|nr:peptide chain release factor aRF-1 [Halobacteriales archaeon]